VRLDGVVASDYLLLAPGASQELPVPDAKVTRHLAFKALTDYGGVRRYCVQGDVEGFQNTEYRQKDC
jgi:hypothetical protein